MTSKKFTLDNINAIPKKLVAIVSKEMAIEINKRTDELIRDYLRNQKNKR
jgi:hypothetical protein